jgi:hypothetical protein
MNRGFGQRAQTNLASTPDSGSFLKELFPSRTYLENGYARIFGEVPLEFSNEAPAVIWNLSLPTWPQT